MNANLYELALVAGILAEYKFELTGIKHVNFGCSDYQLQYKAYGLEFYLEKSKLEQGIKKGSYENVSTFVKLANAERGAFYELLRS